MFPRFWQTCVATRYVNQIGQNKAGWSGWSVVRIRSLYPFLSLSFPLSLSFSRSTPLSLCLSVRAWTVVEPPLLGRLVGQIVSWLTRPGSGEGGLRTSFVRELKAQGPHQSWMHFGPGATLFTFCIPNHLHSPGLGPGTTAPRNAKSPLNLFCSLTQCSELAVSGARTILTCSLFKVCDLK